MQLLGEDGVRADPYAAYCVDNAVRIFGQWADGQMQEQLSERDEQGNPVRNPEDVYREVMGIELTAAEKREIRREANERRKMMMMGQ